MYKLLKSLEYLHSEGIVHRDIKPENILMKNHDNDEDFVIADFGLATFLRNQILNICCGSPGYVAPEILRKSPYGTKVDIFSAGVIMYLLLSGRAPFLGKKDSEVIAQNREAKIYF